jgi:hypothetical protein
MGMAERESLAKWAVGIAVVIVLALAGGSLAIAIGIDQKGQRDPAGWYKIAAGLFALAVVFAVVALLIFLLRGRGTKTVDFGKQIKATAAPKPVETGALGALADLPTRSQGRRPPRRLDPPKASPIVVGKDWLNFSRKVDEWLKSPEVTQWPPKGHSAQEPVPILNQAQDAVVTAGFREKFLFDFRLIYDQMVNAGHVHERFEETYNGPTSYIAARELVDDMRRVAQELVRDPAL